MIKNYDTSIHAGFAHKNIYFTKCHSALENINFMQALGGDF